MNHEVYGGIYSQMIFGESFQEPVRSDQAIKNFVVVDGSWQAKESELIGGNGPGPKLLSLAPAFSAGDAGVEVYFPGAAPGNGGLIVKAANAGAGADNFDGYEVSIDVARKVASLSRHHHNWKLLKEVPCDVSADRWIKLGAKMTETTIDITVDGKQVIQFEDRDDPLRSGTIGLRDWQRPVRYRNLWMEAGAGRVDLPFESVPVPQVSALWHTTTRGSAKLHTELVDEHPFVGAQSQRITFTSGDGEVGIENQGLNRWGMSFVAGKPYEGHVWVRTDRPTDVFVSLESRDGSRRYADTKLAVHQGDWTQLNFSLIPDTTDPAGRFFISLRSPGSIDLGYAFLQPGEWGRFGNLPVRRDVVEGLIDQGVTVMRYGGSMVNAPEYRWKKMIGPRDLRQPYKGTWYPYSTNGWGILDFLDLCEAAGFLGVPDFNIDQTPQDMKDFVEYANGSNQTEWGRRRAESGHPKPYGLRYLELGNEERVDEKYAAQFEAIAKAIWQADPPITLVVGDFVYGAQIADPMKFSGAASGITSMAGHQKILELAMQTDREVWFDVHVGTEGPGLSGELKALPTYIDALEKISAGAKHRVVVFELNSGNHAQKRALANAWAIGTAIRDGRIPIMTAANCLQPDKQNDNGWDQGLLFLNPSQVWLQPPGYVTQMISRNYEPQVLDTEVRGGGTALQATATRSEDGKTIVLQVVNLSAAVRTCSIRLDGFSSARQTASVAELTGPLDSTNTAENPRQIEPSRTEWKIEMQDGAMSRTIAPYSFTVIRFE